MKILVVDDEKNIRESIIKFLSLETIEGRGAANGLSALRLLEEDVFDAAVVDLKMDGMDGLTLLGRLKEERPLLPVIMISAFGEVQDAVSAMKLGARDYIVKPFDPEELVLKIKSVVENQRLKNTIASAGHQEPRSSSMIGDSSEIKKIKKLIEKVAANPSNVLILGESGTGKEVAARMIHECSGREDKPFVAVNLGGIPENLLESELFGYEKGAFTGAVSNKPGLFETASAGTIFLDEIGDMPLHLQVKLLRVIQERKIQRLGSTKLVPVNARLISATNRNLDQLVKEGTFREDLFFRLNVIKIELPPLRDRKEDIRLLAGHFIAKFNALMDRKIKNVTPGALEKLESYDFPGNIRELENIIERAFIFCETDNLTPHDIDIKEQGRNSGKKGTIKEVEHLMIIEALQRWEGNRTKAADELGITRRTLINKIKEYKIDL